MAQNEETTEAVEAEETLTSYTSESSAADAAAPKKERPALTVAGAAVGRRKEAVARVRVVPGSGKWTINGRALDNYFPNKLHQQDVNEPFKILDLDAPTTSSPASTVAASPARPVLCASASPVR